MVEVIPFRKKQNGKADKMPEKVHASNYTGKALQRLRKENGWTLSNVSSRTGVAISTISKIENNRSSPNYDVLVRLSEGLGVDFLELLTGGGSFSTFAPGSRTVNRIGQGIRYETPIGEYEALSGELAKKVLQPMLVRVPKGRHAPPATSSHSGEEFVYVLSGTLEFHMEPYSPTILESGESVHFDARMPHGFVAVGDLDALFLSVCASAKGMIKNASTKINPSKQNNDANREED